MYNLIRIIIGMQTFTKLTFSFSNTNPTLRLPSFSHFKLYPKILQALQKQQIVTPTFIQYSLLTKLYAQTENKYFHIVSPTGTGKTLAYMIPIMDHIKKQQVAINQRLTMPKIPRAIVITANKELVLQTTNVGKMLSHFCKARCDGIGIGASLFSEDKLVKEGVDVLVSTNVRFSRMEAKKKLFLTYTDWIVIDEVDTLFQSNFHKTNQLIENIIKPNCNKHLKIIFSSTTNPQSLSQYLHKAFPSLTQVVDKKVHINLENIKHEFMQSQSYDKHQPLMNLLHRERNTKTIIFCNTVASLHELEYYLCQQGIKIVTLHSQLSKQARIKNYQLFRDDENGILLATDLGSRGLDFPHLKRVINYDFPLTTCDYLQRAGRTGRAGKKGNVISLYFKKDLPIINELKGASFKEPLKIRNSAYGYKNREDIKKSKFK